MQLLTNNPKDLVGIKKPPLWLIPRVALIHESQALKDGARKYGPYNWRNYEVSYTTYLAAIDRHLASVLDGEDYSEDSGAHHLAHIRACCAIILDAIEQGKIVDDRPPPGKAAEIIKRFTE